MERECALAKETLPLMDALETDKPEFPAYARQRLQTKVRQTLGGAPSSGGTPDQPAKVAWLGWRWLLGLGVAAAVAALLIVPRFLGGNELMVQLAVLDVAGAVRGGDTNEVALLRQHWPEAALTEFDQADTAGSWEAAEPAQRGKPVARIIYDHAAAEVRVNVWQKGNQTSKSFAVNQGLEATMREVKQFVAETLGHR